MLHLEGYAQFFDLKYSRLLLPAIVSCTMRRNRIERVMDECESAAFFQKCISKLVKNTQAQIYQVVNRNEKARYKIFIKY